MNKFITIIFLLSINFAFTQENIILDSIIKNVGHIYSNKPLSFSIDGNIYEELNNNMDSWPSKLSTLKNDSLLKKDFPKEINFNRAQLWSNEELKSKYLVDDNVDYLRFKKVKKILNLTNPEEIKVLKEEIKTFNNRFNDWSKFPVQITRPYFSYSKTYAIIVIQFGNDSGQSILLKKINGVFQFYTNIRVWTY